MSKTFKIGLFKKKKMRTKIHTCMDKFVRVGTLTRTKSVAQLQAEI